MCTVAIIDIADGELIIGILVRSIEKVLKKNIPLATKQTKDLLKFMFRNLIQKTFDVREGEYKISLLMLLYIFLILAVLLIIKPTVNALFLTELGVEHLPFAFLAVGITAIGSLFYYSKALAKFSLNKIIEVTLLGSIIVLIGFAVLLKLNIAGGWILYLFYVWVAIYAVLSASQFWVLANLVYNVREAKRLFGFIGSGAILGGIFGGYLTSLLAPLIGTENLIFLSAVLLLFCIPILRTVWQLRVKKLGKFRKRQKTGMTAERPFQHILHSKHLTYIACIAAVSVLVAKLVDYLFSDFASATIPDPEELTAFFAFWFSTFNLLSLVIQLFFTNRIVGIWGVGFSLLLLPIGIFAGSVFFFILPELSAVIVIKAMDGVLKQSVNKSASELLALPLPLELRNKTKSFIDVVVNSIATALAGGLLIFVVRGLNLPSFYITAIIVFLVPLWVFFILRLRKEYYKTFSGNLEMATESSSKSFKVGPKKTSVIKGMRSVFQNGTEEQLLFMLDKLLEVNDKRFEKDVESLLGHPSTKVRTAAIQNLYFLNASSMVSNIGQLLHTDDSALTLATLEYLLLHAQKNSSLVYDRYLEHENQDVSDTALYCLAREARNNDALKSTYSLKKHIEEKIEWIANGIHGPDSLKTLLKTIGSADLPEYYSWIKDNFKHPDSEVVKTAIWAAGTSKHIDFVTDLIYFLPKKPYRKAATDALLNYGTGMVPVLTGTVKERLVSIETCRFVPMALKAFYSQDAVRSLFRLIDNEDLGIRLESIRALSDIRKNRPELKFDKNKVVAFIFEECKLHHKTLSAMHTQIIISNGKRTKSKKEISKEERDARSSLLKLLERHLDAGLERIFKLLGLFYQQRDIEIAYGSLLSDKSEVRANAIEFLDNLLTGDLKRTLLPIIEETALDISSKEALQQIKLKVSTELDCFQLLLEGNDLKAKLAVLHLIKQQKNSKYLPLAEKYSKNENPKVRTFAKEAFRAIQSVV